MSTTPLLDTISFPHDMRGFSDAQLEQLALELRSETIDAVAQTGGHLGAGLGVVELTVALHHTFNTPEDIIIWDVGHQSYPHKILTGRRDKIRTLRKPNGLSGFCKRDESVYDAFGAGHSSTSISAALGMAVARDLSGKTHEVIAVIGDGAMSAGMAFEALNNAGSLGTRLIVVLNDNDMSIAPPVGAMSAYLARLISSRPYHKLRDIGKAVIGKFPEPLAKFARRAEHLARDIAVGGTLFEQLGFYYVGPVDGHNLSQLLPVLKNIKNEKDSGPILLHVVTRKNHINNATQFLHSPVAQEDAVRKYHTKVWQYITAADLDSYIGKKIDGVEITPLGLLAGAHLKGIGKKNSQDNSTDGLRQYLESGGKIDPIDGNGTPISKYMKEMAGYDNSPNSPIRNREAAPDKHHSKSNKTAISSTHDDNLAVALAQYKAGEGAVDGTLPYNKPASTTKDMGIA